MLYKNASVASFVFSRKNPSEKPTASQAQLWQVQNPCRTYGLYTQLHRVRQSHCVNGDRHFNGQNGLHNHFLCESVRQQRLKVPLTKMVTLTVVVNEALPLV